MSGPHRLPDRDAPAALASTDTPDPTDEAGPGLASSPPTEASPRSLDGLHRQNRQLRALCDLSAALLGDPSLPTIDDAAIAALDTAIRPDRASVLRIDPDGVMRFKAWRGLSDAYRAATQGHSPWSATTRNPAPVLIPDVVRAPDLSESLRQTILGEGIRALAFIPVAYQGRLLGTFMLSFDRPHPFSDDELMLARTIAGHIAVALARVEATQDLSSSRDQLALILRDVADGITVQDTSGNIVFANPAAARMIGFSSVEELLATPTAEIMKRFVVLDEHGQPFAPDRLPGRRALRGEPAAEAICRFRSVETDEERWSIVKATPALDNEGRVRYAINVFLDITERRRAQEAQARLAAIVRFSDDAIISKDLDGTIRSWNGGAERLYQYTAADVVGRPITVIFPPERLDEFPEIMGRLRRNEAIDHYETVRVRKDGQRVDVSVSISPIRDGTGRITGAATIARDITAQKRAERIRRFLAEATTLLGGSLEYEETFSRIARLAVPDLADWCLVDVVEPDGELRRLTVAHADPARADLARRIREQYAPAEDRTRGVWQVIRTGRSELNPGVSDAMLVEVAPDEERLQILREIGFCSSMTVPMTARGRTFGAITLIAAESGRRYGESDLDVVEDLARRAALAVDNARLYADERHARQSAEQAREQALEAIRIRDEFLSVASHELRTPLTSLQARAQLMLRRIKRDGLAEPERFVGNLEEIRRQAERLGTLIGQLLDISRFQAGRLVLERQPTDLVALVRQVVEAMHADTADHPIRLRAPAALTATVDGLRLEQVLTNLLDNAIKYGQPGGPIDVTVGTTGDGGVEIGVRDYGRGIPPDRRSAIFERYYRAHADTYQSGLGLGLYISREIVELHGGTIAAEFPADGGSRFVVRLPRDGAQAPVSGAERTGAE